MNEPSLSNLTLRELIIEAQKLSRDLADHLDRNFLPKVNQLKRQSQPTSDSPYPLDVEDITVRNQVKVVLESEKYTNSTYKKLHQYCKAIDEAVSKIVDVG